MKNLFSSPASTGLIKIYSNIDLLLNEQRKQRADLAQVLRMLNQIINSLSLQKQVEDYFEDKQNPEAEEIASDDSR